MSEDTNFGVLMFAHGARDPRWAEPFLRVAARVRADAPGLLVELAYLEFMKPSLGEAVQRLVDRGARRIRVVPLFFGPGGHLRNEVPELIRVAMVADPGLSIELAAAAGEDDGVIAAIAAYCLRHK
ncbi:MAG: CbiX/SirB N-terminal domain-containing protein [Betaproteobacteria bacterium]